MKYNIPFYLAKQLENFFPISCADELNRFNSDLELLQNHHNLIYTDYQKTAQTIRIFSDYELDPHHIMQYPIYLYKLSRSLYLKPSDRDDYKLKQRIHALNKYLHGCSIFYKVNLPKVFFLNYASGCVLGQAQYSERLIAYQQVTVGTVQQGVYPTIGKNCILMPNSVVSGAAKIGDNCIISAGVRVLGATVPDNSIVFEGHNKKLAFSENNLNLIEKYLNKED